MPLPRNYSSDVRFPPGYLIPGSPSWGEVRREIVAGWRYDKDSDSDRNQVLAYNGQRTFGRSIRARPRPGQSYFGYYEPGIVQDTPYVGSNDWNGGNPAYGAKTANKAYAKFKEEALGDTAQLGAFIAEGRESYGMIARRATGLYRSYKALRRGQFKKFLKELSVDPKRKHRNKVRAAAHEASGLWLEYWFGWSPAVNDMFNAIEQLNRSPNPERLSASSGMKLPFLHRSAGGSNARRDQYGTGKLFWKTGATCVLSNPDQALLASLGLINPLSIAWEVVPFSFVVDWFTQFGNVLDAKTDFLGIQLVDAYRTSIQKTVWYHDTWNNAGGMPPADRRVHNVVIEYRSFNMRRWPGLISPVALRPKLLNFGSSTTRAATAVSLLTAIFIGK